MNNEVMRQPFDYAQVFYNEVICYLEAKWERKLTEHERHTLIEGYKFGRMAETHYKTPHGAMSTH